MKKTVFILATLIAMIFVNVELSAQNKDSVKGNIILIKENAGSTPFLIRNDVEDLCQISFSF